MSEADQVPKANQLLAACAHQLAEHFDSVQIIVTHRTANGSTASIPYGVGNWFARYGSVRDWITAQEAKTKRDATAATTDGVE